MESSEIQSVNKVYNTAYGNIRPDSYFEWEFVSSPWGRAIYIIAEDLEKEGNKIVGTQSAIPIMLTNGKEKVLTAKSEDTFVDPAYRGQKLFDKMYDLLFSECVKAGIKYIWGFTYARKPFEKIGFTVPFSSIQGILVKKPWKAAEVLINLNPENNYRDKIKIHLGTLYNFLYSKLKIRSGDLTDIGNNFDFFVTKQNQILKDNSLWSIEFSEKYIDWRIKQNPYKNTFYSVVTNDSAVIINNKTDGTLYLEEIILNTPNSDKLMEEMFNTINTINKNLTYSLMRYWGFDTNILNKIQINLLRSCGFTFINKGTFFVWKKLDGKNEITIDPNNLLISRLYTQGNR